MQRFLQGTALDNKGVDLFFAPLADHCIAFFDREELGVAEHPLDQRSERHVCNEFINWSVSPEAQTMITDNLWTAPVLPRDMLPDLSDEAFERASSTIKPIIPNYDVYVDKGDWLDEKWEEYLADV